MSNRSDYMGSPCVSCGTPTPYVRCNPCALADYRNLRDLGKTDEEACALIAEPEPVKAGRQSGKSGLQRAALKPTFREFARSIIGHDQPELPPHVERLAQLFEEGARSVVIATSPRHGRMLAFRLATQYLAQYEEEE